MTKNKKPKKQHIEMTFGLQTYNERRRAKIIGIMAPNMPVSNNSSAIAVGGMVGAMIGVALTRKSDDKEQKENTTLFNKRESLRAS